MVFVTDYLMGTQEAPRRIKRADEGETDKKDQEGADSGEQRGENQQNTAEPLRKRVSYRVTCYDSTKHNGALAPLPPQKLYSWELQLCVPARFVASKTVHENAFRYFDTSVNT